MAGDFSARPAVDAAVIFDSRIVHAIALLGAAARRVDARVVSPVLREPGLDGSVSQQPDDRDRDGCDYRTDRDGDCNRTVARPLSVAADSGEHVDAPDDSS